MATQFVGFQPPPGSSLKDYDRTASPDHQPTSIPTTFLDAMQVREEVYVKEQAVPLENELDDDDPRSFHWVVYASVGSTAAVSPASMRPTGGTASEERRKSESTATRVAVGTIRLVPPPHAVHLVAGSSEHRRTSVEIPKKDSVEAEVETRSDTPLFQALSEPYIKLGRLATLPAYRGLGLSRLLVNAAITWAKDHPDDILPARAPSDIEAAKQEGKPEWVPWHGLILVHAQTAVQKLWESYGFVKDEAMGTWFEEGIEHIGMWRRIEVQGGGPKMLVI